jgi:hypothetical protein
MNPAAGGADLTPFDYFSLGFGVAKEVFSSAKPPDVRGKTIELLLEIAQARSTMIDSPEEVAAALKAELGPRALAAADLAEPLRASRRVEQAAAQRILHEMFGANRGGT